MSVFSFIDSIAEVDKESLTAFFTLKGSEEFLKDHFDGFPVMPGVLLLEALKQAASRFMEAKTGAKKVFFRIDAVDEIKFGRFVKPGDRIKLFVRRLKKENNVDFFEGRVELDGGRALWASFGLRPLE